MRVQGTDDLRHCLTPKAGSDPAPHLRRKRPLGEAVRGHPPFDLDPLQNLTYIAGSSSNGTKTSSRESSIATACGTDSNPNRAATAAARDAPRSDSNGSPGEHKS